MYCTECGKLQSDTAKFCSSCGNKLTISEEAITPKHKKRGPKVRAKQNPDLRLAKFSVFLMISSLFMSYMNNQSGVQIIEMTLDQHWPQWQTNPIKPGLRNLDIFLYVVSPIVFFLSAFFGALTISKGESPKTIGILHMMFFSFMIILSLVEASYRTTPLDPGAPYSVLGYAGYGFWLGGLSGAVSYTHLTLPTIYSV